MEHASRFLFACSAVMGLALASNDLHAASLTVSWDDNSHDEAGFEIERTTDGTNFVKVAVVGADVTKWIDYSVDVTSTYWYRVRAFNDTARSAYSNVTGLTVPIDPRNPDAPLPLLSGMVQSRLANLSARTIAGGGDQSLIVGFVVSEGRKSVLLRVVGPGMADYVSVPTFQDPSMTVRAGSLFVAANDNWAGAERLKTAFSRLGAFPLNAASRDASLLDEFSPGGYTALVNGPGSGLAMAEIYDADSSPHSSGALINLSVRAQTVTGDGVLIVGFVISGNTPLRVLIRAGGPALEKFGVAGTLADPQIRLYRGNQPWDYNDDWSGDVPLEVAFIECGASAWSDPGSKDAALLELLPPGAYTAIISGAEGGSGVVLAEVYVVP